MTQDKGKAVNGIHLAEQLAILFFFSSLNESYTKGFYSGVQHKGDKILQDT